MGHATAPAHEAVGGNPPARCLGIWKKCIPRADNTIAQHEVECETMLRSLIEEPSRDSLRTPACDHCARSWQCHWVLHLRLLLFDTVGTRAVIFTAKGRFCAKIISMPQPWCRSGVTSSRCDITMSPKRMPHPCDIRPDHSDITPRGKLRGYPYRT